MAAGVAAPTLRKEFFVLMPGTTDCDLAKVSAVQPHLDLCQLMGEDIVVECLRSGNVVVRVRNQVQCDKLVILKELGGGQDNCRPRRVEKYLSGKSDV